MENVFESIEQVLELYPANYTDEQGHAISVPDTVLPDRERLEIIVHKLKFIPQEQRPKVAYLYSVSPVSIIPDEYLDRLITIAGGIPMTNPGSENFNPGVLIIISNTPISQLLNELPSALSSSFWPQTDAVRNNNIFVIHHPDYLRDPGQHLAEDTEILAEIINPGYFVYGRDEDAWMQFSV